MDALTQQELETNTFRPMKKPKAKGKGKGRDEDEDEDDDEDDSEEMYQLGSLIIEIAGAVSAADFQ